MARLFKPDIPQMVRQAGMLVELPVLSVNRYKIAGADQIEQLRLVDELNRSYLSRVGHQPELESHIAAMEVAFRMQTEAPEVFDIGRESEATRARYGSRRCARISLRTHRMSCAHPSP